MKDTEFIQKLKDTVGLNTVYCTGAFGHVITRENIKSLAYAYPKNYSNEKIAELSELVGQGYFGFDCVCLIKALLFWGFKADFTKPFGGSVYNPAYDFNEDQMLARCKYKSADFSTIVPGSLVYMKGHVGIYIGEGTVVESSPKWKNGVQYTNLGNVDKYKKGNYRLWTYWGKLPDIEYTEIKPTPQKVEVEKVNIELDVIKKGYKDGVNGVSNVKAMQALLTRHGYPLSIDGSAGGQTITALKNFQSNNSIYKKLDGTIDGVCGKNTWTALLS